MSAPDHAAAPLMFSLWIRNDLTRESARFLGQGASIPEAFAEGWQNACEDFGKSSSGGGPISFARLAVVLPTGERVFRTPARFASRVPYDTKTEFEEVPVCTGDAARPYDGPMRHYERRSKSP